MTFLVSRPMWILVGCGVADLSRSGFLKIFFVKGPEPFYLLISLSYFFGGLLDLLSDLDLRLAGLSRPREPDLQNKL